MMTYQECLDYMFAKLPMYHRVGPAAYKKDLTNIRALCDVLGNPQQNFNSIHIAGTNGKGSITHILYSAFMQGEFVVGMYTSPHYLDFRERIKVNGECIPEEDVISFIEQMKESIEKIQPSFFEITTAMAFWYFQKQECDYCIIETGLGGRLDSTNIIQPILSVISNISYDHMHMLGNSLSEIAFEKAGIIKENVPVVIGESSDEYDLVFVEKSIETNSYITFADRRYAENGCTEGLLSTYSYSHVKEGYQIEFSSDLSGPFQSKNIRTSIVAFEVLSDLGRGIKGEFFVEGLKKVRENTGFMGRWMWLHEKPDVLVDSAHNEGGISVLVARVMTMPYLKIHWILGMVNDKDHDKVLSLLPDSAVYYFTKPSVDRGLEADLLQAKASEFGLQGASYALAEQAVQAALNNASEQDLILIAGSIFMVADVLPLFQK